MHSMERAPQRLRALFTYNPMSLGEAWAWSGLAYSVYNSVLGKEKVMKSHRLPGNARLLPWFVALSMGMGAGLAHAAPTLGSITLKSGSSTYNCALSEFSISAGGLVSATATGCNPALGSTTTPPDTGGGTGGDTGGGTGGTGGDTGGGTGGDTGGGTGGDTGGGTGGTGGGTGGSDPGAGTWSPDLSAIPRVVVVDQAGATGTAETVVPGCVNGGSTARDAGCSRATEYNATINGTLVPVKLTKGQILSVRYPRSPTVSGSSTGAIKLANSVGGAIGIDTLISLSPTPGDLTGNTQPRCVSRSTQSPSVSTGTGTFACKVDRTKSMYYLNIAVQQDCTGSNCIFWIAEGSSEFIN